MFDGNLEIISIKNEIYATIFMSKFNQCLTMDIIDCSL